MDPASHANPYVANTSGRTDFLAFAVHQDLTILLDIESTLVSSEL